MARYKDGLNGPLTGKIGKTIASTWRDIPYLKSVSAKPQKDPSERQLVNRSKFAIVQNFLGYVNDCVQLAFISNPGRRSGRNAAQSYIMLNSCYKIEGGWEIDYPRVLISFGGLKPLLNAEAVLTETGITIKWNIKGSGTEQMIIALIDTQQEIAVESVAEVNRQEGEYTLTLDNTGTEFHFHIYAGTVSRDRRNASNSLYLGCLQYGGA